MFRATPLDRCARTSREAAELDPLDHLARRKLIPWLPDQVDFAVSEALTALKRAEELLMDLPIPRTGLPRLPTSQMRGAPLSAIAKVDSSCGAGQRRSELAPFHLEPTASVSRPFATQAGPACCAVPVPGGNEKGQKPLADTRGSEAYPQVCRHLLRSSLRRPGHRIWRSSPGDGAMSRRER